MKFQAIFLDTERSVIDSEYYEKQPTDSEVLELASKLNSPIIQIYYDRYENENYDELICEYN
jgi:hypothetical protein